MATPTPEEIPAQELPTPVAPENGQSTGAPVALNAQPIAEIEPPCAE